MRLRPFDCAHPPIRPSAHSPFDCLTGEQQSLVRRHLQHRAMAAGQVLLAPGDAPAHLFLLIQGHVQQ